MRGKVKYYTRTLKVLAEPMTQGEAFKRGIIKHCLEGFENAMGFSVRDPETGVCTWMEASYFKKLYSEILD